MMAVMLQLCLLPLSYSASGPGGMPLAADGDPGCDCGWSNWESCNPSNNDHSQCFRSCCAGLSCVVSLSDRADSMWPNIDAMQQYAKRVGAQFHLVQTDAIAEKVPNWDYRWDVRLLKVPLMQYFLSEHRCLRLIWMDDSIAIPQPSSLSRVPDLFTMVDPHKVGGAREMSHETDIPNWACAQMERRGDGVACGMFLNSGLLVMSQTQLPMFANWRMDFEDEFENSGQDSNHAFGGKWGFKDQSYLNAKISQSGDGTDRIVTYMPTNFVVQGSVWKDAKANQDSMLIESACIIHITRGFSPDLDKRVQEVRRIQGESDSLKGHACYSGRDEGTHLGPRASASPVPLNSTTELD